MYAIPLQDHLNGAGVRDARTSDRSSAAATSYAGGGAANGPSLEGVSYGAHARSTMLSAFDDKGDDDGDRNGDLDQSDLRRERAINTTAEGAAAGGAASPTLASIAADVRKQSGFTSASPTQSDHAPGSRQASGGRQTSSTARHGNTGSGYASRLLSGQDTWAEVRLGEHAASGLAGSGLGGTDDASRTETPPSRMLSASPMPPATYALACCCQSIFLSVDVMCYTVRYICHAKCLHRLGAPCGCTVSAR